MKRKRPEPSAPTTPIEALLRMHPTLEPLADIPCDDVVGARDFTGVPYTLLTTPSTLRNTMDLLEYMVGSRGDVVGRRSFVAEDGRVVAVDLFESDFSQSHTIWFFDGVTAHCIEERTEDAVGS